MQISILNTKQGRINAGIALGYILAISFWVWVFSTDTSGWAAEPETKSESPSETWNRVSAEIEASHCPDDILSTYWDAANIVLNEYRETHPRPADPDKRSPINGQGPEYNAIEDSFRDGWPAFAAAHNCKLSGLELPIGDLK